MLTRRHFISLSTAAGAGAIVPHGYTQTGSPTPVLLRAANKILATVTAELRRWAV